MTVPKIRLYLAFQREIFCKHMNALKTSPFVSFREQCKV